MQSRGLSIVGKPTEQSTTKLEYTSDKAVDGSFETNLYPGFRCTHTSMKFYKYCFNKIHCMYKKYPLRYSASFILLEKIYMSPFLCLSEILNCYCYSRSIYSIDRFCSVTSVTEAEDPWWRVDLEAEHCISEVSILNRGDCCSKCFV